jgi:hypothetical protein
VGKTVLVKGFADCVLISYEGQEIAQHKRSFNRNEFIYDILHYIPILQEKPGAFRDGYPFKKWIMPELFKVYRRHLIKRYGEESDRYFIKTLLLLDKWPIKELINAMYKAIKLGVYSDSYILTLLRHGELSVNQPQLITVGDSLSRYKAEHQPLSIYDEMAGIGKAKKGNNYNERIQTR